MTKLQELKQKLAELQDQIEDESKSFFKETSKEIFTKYPVIEEFSWSQYTPYFNDGDECVFSVNYDPEINGINKYNEDLQDIPVKAFDEITELIQSIDLDVMETMFGNHVKVTAKPDTIVIEDYEHD